MTDLSMFTVSVVDVYLGGVFLFIFPTYLNIRWLYFLIPVFLVTLPEYLFVMFKALSYWRKFSKPPVLVFAVTNKVELAFLLRTLLSVLGSTDPDLRFVVEVEWFCDCLSLYIRLEMFSYLKELN